jgi:hypothetical protein
MISSAELDKLTAEKHALLKAMDDKPSAEQEERLVTLQSRIDAAREALIKALPKEEEQPAPVAVKKRVRAPPSKAKVPSSPTRVLEWEQVSENIQYNAKMDVFRVRVPTPSGSAYRHYTQEQVVKYVEEGGLI